MAAEKTPAISASMVVMVPVDLAALCSNDSNAERSVSCTCTLRGGWRRRAAGKGHCAPTRGEAKKADRAPEVTAAAVLPVVAGVRRSLQSQPATRKCLERDHSAHTVDTQLVRVARPSAVRSMHLLQQPNRLRGQRGWRRTQRRGGLPFSRRHQRRRTRLDNAFPDKPSKLGGLIISRTIRILVLAVTKPGPGPTPTITRVRGCGVLILSRLVMRSARLRRRK